MIIEVTDTHGGHRHSQRSEILTWVTGKLHTLRGHICRGHRDHGGHICIYTVLINGGHRVAEFTSPPMGSLYSIYCTVVLLQCPKSAEYGTKYFEVFRDAAAVTGLIRKICKTYQAALANI